MFIYIYIYNNLQMCINPELEYTTDKGHIIIYFNSIGTYTDVAYNFRTLRLSLPVPKTICLCFRFVLKLYIYIIYRESVSGISDDAYLYTTICIYATAISNHRILVNWFAVVYDIRQLYLYIYINNMYVYTLFKHTHTHTHTHAYIL